MCWSTTAAVSFASPDAAVPPAFRLVACLMPHFSREVREWPSLGQADDLTPSPILRQGLRMIVNCPHGRSRATGLDIEAKAGRGRARHPPGAGFAEPSVPPLDRVPIDAYTS